MSKKAVGRPVEPALQIPDDGLGPAMLALAPGHRAFVYFKVFGLMNNKDAAIAAGYSNAGQTAKAIGYNLAHRDDVQAAIREETRKLGTEQGPKSLATVIYLRDKAKDERVRLKASTELLALCGLGPIAQSHVTVDHNVTYTDDDLDRQIIEYSRKLGLGEVATRKMLLKPDRVIDGEFTEVPATPITAEDVARRAALDRENELRRERQLLAPDELAERKRFYAEHKRAQAKERYSAAQTAIATATGRGEQFDVTAAVADAQATYAAAQTDIEDFLSDGSEGLEDLLGSNEDAPAAQTNDAANFVDTQKFPAWRVK
jgi:phage terminase small subunit